MKNFLRTITCVLALAALIIMPAVVLASTITLEPATAQREIGGRVRMHIYVNDAVNLISMGVRVSFDKNVLQVVEASKFEDINDGWLMDADGNPATTDDQYNNPAVEVDNALGTVAMFGGRLTGTSTAGLHGKVLLGWIVFETIANGNSPINVDRFKYHPSDPAETFDNFVNLDGTVDEPVNIPDQLGFICVLDGACTIDANVNGAVDMGDFSMLRSIMGKAFPDPAYNVLLDGNANGAIDMGDFSILRSEMGNECPNCPPDFQ